MKPANPKPLDGFVVQTVTFDVLLQLIENSVQATVYCNISSLQASYLLDRFNNGNRYRRKNAVERYSRDMNKGEWMADVSPIQFSSDRLMNGQHRLAAASRCTTDVVFKFETGHSDELYKHIDEVVPRNLDDRLKVFQDVKTNQTGCQLSKLVGLSAGSVTNRTPTVAEASEFMAQHKSAIIWVASVRTKEMGTGQATVAYAAMEYFERNTEKAEAFYPDLFLKDGSISQARICRDFIIRHSAQKGSGCGAKLEAYQKTVMCMKAHMEGRPVKNVTRSSW